MVRVFDTGARRSSDSEKICYRGFLSPAVLQRYGQYMRGHALLPDGSRRPPDEWKLGIPVQSYLDSLLRHTVAVWLIQEGWQPEDGDDIEDHLCGVIFNAQGMLHEVLKAKGRCDD